MPEQINIAIAAHLGMWVYHYDKAPPSRCYSMLVDDELNPVAGLWGGKFEGYRTGERATLEEVLNDVPQWSNNLDLAMTLLEEDGCYYRIERIPHGDYSVRVKKTKHSRERYEVLSDDLADAICAAYCAYHQIDIDAAKLEGAD